MKKICHITTAHLRYDDRIYRKECCSLAKLYETHLIVNDDGKDEVVDGVHIHSLNKPISKRVDRLKLLNVCLKVALKLDADIYHLHDPELLLIAGKLCRYGKKVIFDSHEDYFFQISNKIYLPIIFRRIIAWIYYKYETKVCKMIAAVIFPTTIDGKNPFKNRCKKFAYINNYPVMVENGQYRKYENREKVVCYTGGLSESRGISELIDACDKCGARLILAGAFSSKKFEEKIRRKESFRCVDYRGWVSFEEVLKIYQESTVGASVLHDVGQYYRLGNLPTKVYEYFQQGLPVIISDYPYARECIKKYTFGYLVEPLNINDIAKAIDAICNDSEKAKRMGTMGYAAYENEFNWQCEEKKLFSLYSQII